MNILPVFYNNAIFSIVNNGRKLVDSMYCLQHRQQEMGPQTHRKFSVRSPQPSRYASSRLLSWECSTCTDIGNSSRPITMAKPESLHAETTLDAVFHGGPGRLVMTLAGSNYCRSRLLCLVCHHAITICQHLWHPSYAVIYWNYIPRFPHGPSLAYNISCL